MLLLLKLEALFCATFESAQMPISNEVAADIGIVNDPGEDITVAGVVGVVGVAMLSTIFPSLFEPTRRIISGVEKSAGPRVSATYIGAFRLSFLSFFVPIRK